LKRSIKLSLASQALPQVIEAVAELADCFARQGRAKEALELILPVLQHPAQTKVTKQRVLKLRSMIEAQFAPGDLEKTAESETLESVLAHFSA
jgi:thioredoxin-like negative regulator of GroEL